MKKIFTLALTLLIGTAAFAQKFAHVSYEELVMLMPEMDKVRTQLDDIVKENEDVMKTMYEEFQTKYQTYQQKGSTWTAAVRESKEKELSEMQNRIQETQQSMQQEMQTIQNNLTAPVYKKCQEAVETEAKKAGYIYVFNASDLLYVDKAQSVDLTPALRKVLGIPDGRTLETLQKEMQEKAAQAQAAQ